MSSPSQEGGLPAVTDVAVPLGLTLIAHWLADSDDKSTIRKIEKRLATDYDRFVDLLPELPLDLSGGSDDDQDWDDQQENEWDAQDDEWDYEGGSVGQLAQDLATPALLTLGAHYLASTDDDSVESPVSFSERFSFDEMEGGSPLGGAFLKTVDDLIVPLGLMTGAHLLQNRQKRRGSQTGGSWGAALDLSVPLGLTVLAHTLAKDKNDYSMVGGSGLPIIGDSALGEWLASAGETVLTPNTLLPLGVIFVLYMAYRRYAESEPEAAPVSAQPDIKDLAYPQDLALYNNRRGINRSNLNDDTRFPFALAMGPEAFHAYVEADED